MPSLATTQPNGHHEALTTIHARYSELLRRYITRTLQRRAPVLVSDADDILQDVFERVHTHCEVFLDEMLLKPRLILTAKRLVHNHIKQEYRSGRDVRRNVPLEEDPSGRTPDATEHVANKEITNRYLGDLTPQEREIIRLHYFADYSVPEIAGRMGLDKEVVLYRIRSSLAKMRKTAPA